ncbi:MAG TPA: oxidoreductase, partial [Chitinophagaceae bacterium]
GAVAGMQLAHAGRKASRNSPWKGGDALQETAGGWQTFAPTALPFKDDEPIPAAMTTEQIAQAVDDFKAAAVRALQAGFQLLEIHAAHGYLINEFLSPLSNHRMDQYGGDFDNRVRFLFEIVDAVRSVVPAEVPLFVRISCSEWVDGGWAMEDSIRLVESLKTKGVDLIDCSSGGNSASQRISVGPMYQVPFAEKIKQETGIMTGAVGLITTAEQSESILQAGQADLVILARQFLRDPYFPLHAAKQLGVDVPWPPQYERARRY